MNEDLKKVVYALRREIQGYVTAHTQDRRAERKRIIDLETRVTRIERALDSLSSNFGR